MYIHDDTLNHLMCRCLSQVLRRKQGDAMRKTIVLLIVIMTMFVSVSRGFSSADAEPVLKTVQRAVTAELNRMDAGLKEAAHRLGASGLVGEDARSALKELCSKYSYAVDCAAVDLKGTMVTIEPSPFRKFEGVDISAQEQVKQIMKTGAPVLSSVFRAVEGFPAVDAEYPVVSPDGQRIGSVSILFHPERLLGSIIAPTVQGMPVDIWVMEKGGLILYDVDMSQIGLDLFRAQLYAPYTELTALGRRIAAVPEGEGIYTFRRGTSNAIVTKNAFWQTASLYGTEWRLVAIHIEQDDISRSTGIAVPAALTEKKLESMASSRALVSALSSGDTKTAMALFKEFYDDNPGVYSVQWIDGNGINRFGYPQENSLNAYDYRSRAMPGDQDVITIWAERKPAVHEMELFEGRTGSFTFRPVFDREQYQGMLYYIKLKPEQALKSP